MTHMSEREFQAHVVRWFAERVPDVSTNLYLSGERWFVDIVAEMPPVTYWIEVENDAESIRDGVGQALGYAGGEPHGVPLVVIPPDHMDDERVRRLRAADAVVIRAFDPECGVWI